jgi:hypothetical protein
LSDNAANDLSSANDGGVAGGGIAVDANRIAASRSFSICDETFEKMLFFPPKIFSFLIAKKLLFIKLGGVIFQSHF